MNQAHRHILLGALTRCVFSLAIASLLFLSSRGAPESAAASFLGKIAFFYGVVLSFISSSVIPRLNELRPLEGLDEDERHALNAQIKEKISGLWGLFLLSVASAICGIAAGEFKDSSGLAAIGFFLFSYISITFTALPYWINEIEDFKNEIKLRALRSTTLEKRLTTLEADKSEE